MEDSLYKIGDTIYYIENASICEDEIVGIKRREKGAVKTSQICQTCRVDSYTVNTYEGFVYLRKGLREKIRWVHSFSGGSESIDLDRWLEEDKIFPDKESLLASL